MDEATELSGEGQVLDDIVPDTSHQSDISTKFPASESSLGSDPNIIESAPQLDSTPTQMEMDDSSEPAEQSPVEDYSPNIVYILEYRNINTGDIIFTKEFNEPQAVQDTLVSGNIPVLEVVTEVRSLQKGDLQKDAKLQQPPSVHSVAGTKLKINSPAIVTALQSVVEYYPGYTFLEESVTIAEPYAILIHHEKELASYRKRFAPGTSLSEDQKCERKRDTYEHLGLLEKYLQDRMGPSVLAERQRHARGYATFEMLWMLYKPGTDVYLYHHQCSSHSAAVVESTDEESRRTYHNVLRMNVWYMRYNGTFLGRESEARYLSPYDGEKEIAKLEIFPCHFLNENIDQEGFKSQRTRLEERGKMFWRLTKKQCMHYNGLTATYNEEHASQLLELGMSDLLTSPSLTISSWSTRTLITSKVAARMMFLSLIIRVPQPYRVSQIASAVCV